MCINTPQNLELQELAWYLLILGKIKHTPLNVADDNVFEDNAQNVMTDGDLEIPNEAILVPELSDLD